MLSWSHLPNATWYYLQSWCTCIAWQRDGFSLAGHQLEQKVASKHFQQDLSVNQLLCLGLLAAEVIAQEKPEIALTGFGSGTFRKNLHKYSDTHGLLQTQKWTLMEKTGRN